MVQLGRGDLLAALQASPLVVLGAPVWVLWPRVGRALRARLSGRALAGALAAALLASELWQLERWLG